MEENIDLPIDIDQKKTAQKVRNFFKYNFEHYLIRAGYHRTDLSSPQLDPTGIMSHGGNSAENKMASIFDAQDKCQAVYHAIEKCADSSKQPFRTILKSLYIEELTDWQVAAKVQYSDSRYSDLKRYALCQFADTIDTWKTIYNVKIPELKVFKNRVNIGSKSEKGRVE